MKTNMNSINHPLILLWLLFSLRTRDIFQLRHLRFVNEACRKAANVHPKGVNVTTIIICAASVESTDPSAGCFEGKRLAPLHTKWTVCCFISAEGERHDDIVIVSVSTNIPIP